MQPSVFNVRVPLPNRDDVFLMNTLTDAQLLVSPTSRRSSIGSQGLQSFDALTGDERETADLLQENGFLVADRQSDHRALDRYFASVTSDSSELHITVLTTLQCNFACDYCFQGDHGDYNKFAEKMTLETAARTAAWVEREMDRVSPGTRHADVLRRRAAAQPPGDVLPLRAAAPVGGGARHRCSASASSPTACCSPRTSWTACCRSVCAA